MNNDDIQGKWSGKVYGTEGWRANIDINLSADSNIISGNGHLHLVADGHMEESPLSVEGNYSGENEVVLNLKFDGTDRTATMKARYQALEHHAKGAIYGTYEQITDKEKNIAVVILWQFVSQH